MYKGLNTFIKTFFLTLSLMLSSGKSLMAVEEFRDKVEEALYKQGLVYRDGGNMQLAMSESIEDKAIVTIQTQVRQFLSRKQGSNQKYEEALQYRDGKVEGFPKDASHTLRTAASLFLPLARQRNVKAHLCVTAI